MSIPNVPTVPGRRYPWTPRPYTNIVPLSIRDTTSIQAEQEEVKHYLFYAVVPHINDTFVQLAGYWEETVQKLVDELVDASVILQDPVMAGIVADDDSATRIALNQLFADSVIEDPNDEGFFIVNTPS